MLTTYASCWGSFVLRGSALALFGATLLAAPARATEAALALVLLASAANTASTGLRMRASSTGWWLPVAEAVASVWLAMAIVTGHAVAGLPLAAAAAGLAALGGLQLAALAWRHRNGAYPAWPIVAAGLVSIGFGTLLTRYAALAAGRFEPAAAALALALGVASVLVGLQLRAIGRQVRHELLRDAPLGCAGPLRAVGGLPPAARPAVRLSPPEARVPA